MISQCLLAWSSPRTGAMLISLQENNQSIIQFGYLRIRNIVYWFLHPFVCHLKSSCWLFEAWIYISKAEVPSHLHVWRCLHTTGQSIRQCHCVRRIRHGRSKSPECFPSRCHWSRDSSTERSDTPPCLLSERWHHHQQSLHDCEGFNPYSHYRHGLYQGQWPQTWRSRQIYRQLWPEKVISQQSTWRRELQR